MQDIIAYWKWLCSSSGRWFDMQLLQPLLSGHAAVCRLCIGVACVLFFSSWYGRIDTWGSDSGPLNTEVARFLIGDGIEGTGSAYRLSPFFDFQGSTFAIVYLFCGTIASFVLITGFGGRLSAVPVLILMLGILHRFSMLQNLGELLLCSIVPYLMIDSGWVGQAPQLGFADNRRRWTVGLMIGLLRWHLMIWVMASLASHLSQTMWWEGNGIWYIAANGQSPLFTADFIAANSWASPLVGNIWLLSHLAFLTCLGFSKLRPLGIVVGMFYWLMAYLLTGDSMYAVAGVAATSCIFYEASDILKRLRS